jgi:hypothetical protein
LNYTIRFLLIISLLFILNSKALFGQNNWQQEVHYNIDVKLNDTLHILEGIENFKYFNNSPDTLHFLYLHIWPNAYKNDRTEFNKQKVRNGDTKFYYSSPHQKGNIKNLLFSVNGKQVSYSDYNGMEDVIQLNLPEALLPNSSVDITTPFTVKIPKIFSRMGHNTQDYQITQWYVKPAVYDQQGWHPMPYLDQGEFYSEYGNYTVSITVPENYVVAATGDLQTEFERKFINERINFTKNLNDTTLSNLTKEKIKSNYKFKTIQFKQEKIHDFAWFADKRFLIEKSEQALNNGMKVESFIYYLPQNAKNWKGQTKAINYTIKFLSDSVGNYPYNHASAVDGGILAGSGMEYPNVTVIGQVPDRKTLSTVIIHEVGHNWFYGLLGNNEREFAWMDEGVNTFYEQKIDKGYREKLKLASGDTTSSKGKGINVDVSTMLPFINSQREQKPASWHSANYAQLAYGISVYYRAANILKFMEGYLGSEMFTKCMQTYFSNYCFKHPTPENMQQVFENTSGKNLDCFFKELMPTTKFVDFKIASVKKNGNEKIITIKNKSKTAAPILLSFYKKDSIIATQNLEASNLNSKHITLTDFDKIIIDQKNLSSDINIRNNVYKMNGLLHKTSFKIKPFLGLQNVASTNLYICPQVGFNYYDGFLAGLVFHNLQIVQNKFTFFIAPLYGTNSKQIVGNSGFAFNIYPKKVFKNITLMTSLSKYSHNESSLNSAKPIFANFVRLVPKVIFTLPNNKYPIPISKSITIKQYIIANTNLGYSNNFADSLYRPYKLAAEKLFISQISYAHENKRTLNPFGYMFDIHGNNTFAKMSATGKIKLHYNLPKKALYVRAFAGKMFGFSSNVYDMAPYRLSTTSTAVNDYLLDNYFIGRNAYKKVITNQIIEKEGGGKITTPLLSNPIGLSDNYLLSLNLSTDIPIKMRFKLPLTFMLYADVATYKNQNGSYGTLKDNMASAGIQANLFNRRVQINLPIIMSNNYKSYFKSTYGKNYLYPSMSFTININGLDLYSYRNNSLINKLF